MEFITKLFEKMVIYRTQGLIALGMTVLAFLVGLILIRKLNVRGECNSFAVGLVGIKGRSCLHLSLAWVRFCFYVSFLALAERAGTEQYIVFAILTVGLILMNFSLNNILTEIVGAVVLAVGLFLGSLILGYGNHISSGKEIRVAYILLAVFLAVCAAIILVREYVIISGERRGFDETAETE